MTASTVACSVLIEIVSSCIDTSVVLIISVYPPFCYCSDCMCLVHDRYWNTAKCLYMCIWNVQGTWFSGGKKKDMSASLFSALIGPKELTPNEPLADPVWTPTKPWEDTKRKRGKLFGSALVLHVGCVWSVLNALNLVMLLSDHLIRFSNLTKRLIFFRAWSNTVYKI